jgi:sugar phosphate isomerase/epimerase
MAQRTPGPWNYVRAPQPTDGEFDCAISAFIDGKRQVIAECFGRVAHNVRPDSQANAAAIVKWENSFDELVKALERVKIDLQSARTIIEHHDGEQAHGIRQTLEIVDAALAKAKP